MTNKIYLSFNHLYSLKDGDYHGATLTYRIKHGDDLLVEGEIKGKSLSPFIRPIDIKETEITKPLVVEYVCNGNVEDVSAFPTMSAPRHQIDQSGKVFISNAFIKQAEDACLIGGTLPKIGDFPRAPDTVTYSVGINIGVSDQREMTSPDELTEKVETIIRAQLRPGGLLFRK